MNTVVMIDKNNGLAFNNRPQSRDRVLMERIAKLTDDAPIEADGHFALMLESYGFTVDPVSCPPAEDAWVWLDHTPDEQELAQIRKLIIARYRAIYPADCYFDFEPQRPEWIKISRQIFAGSSHDKIILEEYVRQ